jgi:hypothetical protein
MSYHDVAASKLQAGHVVNRDDFAKAAKLLAEQVGAPKREWCSLGCPKKRRKLAHTCTFQLWDYRYKRLKLAQLLGQLGVFLYTPPPGL